MASAAARGGDTATGPIGGPIGGPDRRRFGAPTGPTFSEIVRPNPRWYQPTDPVLAVRGANRSQRHGYDGRFDPGERLACRLSAQPVSGYADLLIGRPWSGRSARDPSGRVRRAVAEASLDDPNAWTISSRWCRPTLGWTLPQVRNRLNGELVLSLHLNAARTMSANSSTPR